MFLQMSEDRKPSFYSSDEEPIKCHFVDARWLKLLPTLPHALPPLMSALLTELDLKKDFFHEINVVFEGDKRLQELNKTFRGKNKPTNVLSFPYEEDPLLGDIFISFDRVAEEAEEQGKRPEHHLLHLVLHGLLHLLGYDHETDEEAQEMENLEIKILAHLNISNPYKEREDHV